MCVRVSMCERVVMYFDFITCSQHGIELCSCALGTHDVKIIVKVLVCDLQSPILKLILTAVTALSYRYEILISTECLIHCCLFRSSVQSVSLLST